MMTGFVCLTVTTILLGEEPLAGWSSSKTCGMSIQVDEGPEDMR